MALNLQDPETELLAREVARLTGETLNQAVREALAERLRREKLNRGEALQGGVSFDDIFQRLDALPDLDTRSADDIVGYDEHGLPA